MEQVKSLKTGAKYKDTPIGKIPVDWEVVKLRDVAKKFYNGGTPDTTNKDYWNGNIPWMTGADFENQKVGQIRRYITAEGLRNSSSNLIQKGNLLVVTRTGVGKVAIAPFDIAISQDITGVVLDKNKALPGFIYWHLVFNSVRLRTTIQGTSISGLLRGDLEIFNFPLPPLPEQEKIAEILSTVDEAIEKTAQIIEKTKELKKGLMQTVLTRGIGHEKFKKTEIGEIPENWEALKLEDISDEIYRYPTYYNIKYVKQSEGVPEVRGELIKDDGRLSEDLADYRFIDAETSQRFPRTILHEGDFVLSVRGTMGKIGYISKSLENANMTANLMRISPSRRKISPFWLKQFFLSNFFQTRLDEASSATTIKTIKAPELKAIELPIPPLPEQKKIADILSSIDEEIEKESEHREQLESLKKGLMQILLTGQVRVQP
jgi:type I restriction enzyme S subunit